MARHTVRTAIIASTVLLGGPVVPWSYAGPENPLAGPSVEAPKKDDFSIVVQELDGTVKPLETTPEEAAVAKLRLDASALAKVQKVFDRRASQIDQLTIGNLDLFNKLGTATAAGKTLDQLQLGVELWRKTEPLRERGSLRKQVKAALPSDRQSQFDTMLDEYWDAVAADAKRLAKSEGGKSNVVGAKLEGKLKLLGKEIERSFQRQLASGDLVFHFVFRGVELKPEQSERLRSQWADFWQRTKGDASKEEYVGIFMSISSQLDNTQRPIVMENLALLNNGGLFVKKPKK